MLCHSNSILRVFPRNRRTIEWKLLAASLAIVSSGCGEHKNTAIAVPLTKIASDRTAVIELPTIDFNQTVPRAVDENLPAPLGLSLKRSEFVVRFDVRRATDSPRARSVGTFTVGQRGPKGSWMGSAVCHVKPTNDVDESIVHYEGKCPAPKLLGDSLIEVRFGNDAYLVRSTRVE